MVCRIAVDASKRQALLDAEGPDNAEKGRIFRREPGDSAGQTPVNRRDVELVRQIPEPIDLEIDPADSHAVTGRTGDPSARQHGEARRSIPIATRSRPKSSSPPDGRKRLALTLSAAMFVPPSRRLRLQPNVDGSSRSVLCQGKSHRHRLRSKKMK